MTKVLGEFEINLMYSPFNNLFMTEFPFFSLQGSRIYVSITMV